MVPAGAFAPRNLQMWLRWSCNQTALGLFEEPLCWVSRAELLVSGLHAGSGPATTPRTFTADGHVMVPVTGNPDPNPNPNPLA